MKKIFAVSGGILAIGIFFVVFLNLIEQDNEEKISIVDEESIDILSEIPIQNKTIDEINIEIDSKYEKIENERQFYIPNERTWPTSGPFKIDRNEYVLGEKIFMIAENLDINEKGDIIFYRPLNETHHTMWKKISFDGSLKPSFNIYFEPMYSETLKICSPSDLIGDWFVYFNNVNYPMLNFKIINQTLPGEEERFSKNIC